MRALRSKSISRIVAPPARRIPRRRGLSAWRTNRIVHQAAVSAGCDPNKFYGSHSLRKTFAHAVHRACGRDLTVTRAAVCHSSVLVTQRYITPEQAEVDAFILQAGSSMVAA